MGSSVFFSGQRVPCARQSAGTSVSVSRTARLDVSARAGLPSVGMMGTKAGMTQVYQDDGICFAASVISVDEGNFITQVAYLLLWDHYSKQLIKASTTIQRLLSPILN